MFTTRHIDTRTGIAGPTLPVDTIGTISQTGYKLMFQGCSCHIGYPPKRILNWNIAKNRSSIAFVSVVQSIGNFTQNTVVSLPCSAIKKNIGWLIHKLWANEVSRDLGLRLVTDGYPILHSTLASLNTLNILIQSNPIVRICLCSLAAIMF